MRYAGQRNSPRFVLSQTIIYQRHSKNLRHPITSLDNEAKYHPDLPPESSEYNGHCRLSHHGRRNYCFFAFMKFRTTGYEGGLGFPLYCKNFRICRAGTFLSAALLLKGSFCALYRVSRAAARRRKAAPDFLGKGFVSEVKVSYVFYL